MITTVSCPISGHFLQNCNILPHNSTNELKFSHSVASTAGKQGVKFHCLKLFGFFVSTERVRRIRCPNSGQVALFPDDCYEINTPFSLKYSSRSCQNASYKSHINKHFFKKLHFVRILKCFFFDFSKEINSVLKPLRTSSISEFGSAGVKNRCSLKQHFIINYGFTLKMIN